MLDFLSMLVAVCLGTLLAQYLPKLVAHHKAKVVGAKVLRPIWLIEQYRRRKLFNELLELAVHDLDRHDADHPFKYDVPLFQRGLENHLAALVAEHGLEKPTDWDKQILAAVRKWEVS